MTLALAFDTKYFTDSESSLDDLHRSMSELHDNIETAQLDGSYRHHAGIGELADNMDDAETKAKNAEDDSN